jgi:hypothetical protein
VCCWTRDLPCSLLQKTRESLRSGGGKFIRQPCSAALSSCSDRPAEERAENTSDITPTTSDVIPYEDLARAIDQGRIREFEGKHLRIKGYVRAYLALDGKQILVIGEPNSIEPATHVIPYRIIGRPYRLLGQMCHDVLLTGHQRMPN